MGLAMAAINSTALGIVTDIEAEAIDDQILIIQLALKMVQIRRELETRQPNP